MKNPTMLYRSPGSESFEGVSCETSIVEDTEVEAALADGWSLNWIEADEVAKARDEEALKANEAEQARIAAELAAANASGLKAVHKGAGKWAVVDAEGKEVESGLTKEEAQAKAGT